MSKNVSWTTILLVVAGMIVIGVPFQLLLDLDPVAACVVAFLAGIGIGYAAKK